MNLNLEQKAFEDWHFKKYYVENADKDFIYEKFKGSSEYILHTVQYAWEVWQHQQNRISELSQENQELVLSNTCYLNASASYLCKLRQIQSVLNQQMEIAKSKHIDGEVFEDKTETQIADYLDDYNIALDKILSDASIQEQFNAYVKGGEFVKPK